LGGWLRATGRQKNEEYQGHAYGMSVAHVFASIEMTCEYNGLLLNTYESLSNAVSTLQVFAVLRSNSGLFCLRADPNNHEATKAPSHKTSF
jgi:hypothetical protein